MERTDLHPYPVPALSGGYSVDPDGKRKQSFQTRCSDCNTGFSSSDPRAVQLMWWEHMRDEHPKEWSELRGDAPNDMLFAGDYIHY